MVSREELRKAKPSVVTATTRFVRGEITRSEYEHQVERERDQEQRPAGEQTSQPNRHAATGR